MALQDGFKSIEIDPAFAKGYYRVARVYKKQGKFDQAIEMFYKGLSSAQDPNI